MIRNLFVTVALLALLGINALEQWRVNHLQHELWQQREDFIKYANEVNGFMEHTNSSMESIVQITESHNRSIAILTDMERRR